MTSTTVHPLVAQRQTLIEEAQACTKEIESVFGRKDPTSVDIRQSAGGRKAVRHGKIREVEYEMAIAGLEFDVYVTEGPKASKRLAKTQAEIEASLAQAAGIFLDESTYESVRKTANQRITALLKQAEARGYQVVDPRLPVVVEVPTEK